MSKTPIHSAEEYVEQAYFFHSCRERQMEGRAMQEILAQLDQEILATTKLPYAIEFMLAELRHSGRMSQAFARLPHYFTPFQAFVLEQAEEDTTRLTFDQALLILEREAEYRAKSPTSAGLFIFEIETMSRNRLGYMEGLKRLQQDSFFNDDWCEYLELVRMQLGVRELPELVFARSESFVAFRRREDPDYEPTFEVLFGAREGRIAHANIGRDPIFFFAALQRQLGYPEVPRPPKQDSTLSRIEKFGRTLQRLEEKMRILEQELHGGVDLSQFMVGKDGTTPIDRRLSKPDDEQ
jgi:hypothetical protein